MKVAYCVCIVSIHAAFAETPDVKKACYSKDGAKNDCAGAIAHAIVHQSKHCYDDVGADRGAYGACAKEFCSAQCGGASAACKEICFDHALPLYDRFEARLVETGDTGTADSSRVASGPTEAKRARTSALLELKTAQERLGLMGASLQAALVSMEEAHDQTMADLEHQALLPYQAETSVATSMRTHDAAPSFLQRSAPVNLHSVQRQPEDELAQEMTHDLEMNFNKIAPFGKEDTAKELQDHAAKTQDTLVDAVENAEVAEIKRAVFRALTRLRAATIKEFDTIARLETQAIDAYNDAHHYRAENPLAHLHEDEAPVETDKLKSFH